MLLLYLAPAGEVVAHLGREYPIDYHRVGQVAIQVQVGERAHGLADDQLLRIHDQADRAVLAVPQDLVHGDQVDREPAYVREHSGTGNRDVQQRADKRPGRGQDLPLLGKDFLDPPARYIREGEQPQRLAGGCAVDNDDLPPTRFVSAAQSQ